MGLRQQCTTDSQDGEGTHQRIHLEGEANPDTGEQAGPKNRQKATNPTRGED